MNVADFESTINGAADFIIQLGKVDLLDLKHHFEDLKETFFDFKKGGEQLIEEGNVLKIGVVGQVKAGKSSFLNSLLFNGEAVLPKASTPMTAGLTILEYSEQCFFEVDYYSNEDWKEFKELNDDYCEIVHEVRNDKDYAGAPESIIQKEVKSRTTDLQQSAFELVSRCSHAAKNKIGKESERVSFRGIDELQRVLNQYVGADGEYTSVVKSLSIHLNDERLKGIRIVDTPGVNDPIVSRENRTRQFLHSCHGVFFLSYSSRFFDSTDMNFMNTRIGNQGVGTVVFLASKYDDVLQDQGLTCRDDIEKADTLSRCSLERRFHAQKEVLVNKDVKMVFDTTSGISYSLATKPREAWDEMEQHVARRMREIFPSAFMSEEDAIDTFTVLANLDVIKTDYLEGMFRENKDSIIQSKIKDYFRLNAQTIESKVNSLTERLHDKIRELNSVTIEDIRTQQKMQTELFANLQDQFANIIGRFQNNLKKQKQILVEDIHRPECRYIPTQTSIVNVRSKDNIIGLFSVNSEHTMVQVDTISLYDRLSETIDDYISAWHKGWRQYFEQSKMQMFDELCNCISELSQQSSEASFCSSYYRNLIDQVLSDVDRYSILELQEAVTSSKENITYMCDCESSIKTSLSYNCKKRDVGTMLSSLSDNSCQRLKSLVQDELSELVKKVDKAVSNNMKPIMSSLDGLKSNIAQKLKEIGDEYLQRLEAELKEKVATEEKINIALELLEKTRIGLQQ